MALFINGENQLFLVVNIWVLFLICNRCNTIFHFEFT